MNESVSGMWVGDIYPDTTIPSGWRTYVYPYTYITYAGGETIVDKHEKAMKILNALIEAGVVDMDQFEVEKITIAKYNDIVNKIVKFL